MLRLRLRKLAEGVHATATVSLGRRGRTQGIYATDLFGVGGRCGRDEIKHEQNQAKHGFSDQGQVATRAPLPVKEGVPTAEVSSSLG